MIEVTGYEKEMVNYLPEHPERLDDYCYFLANLYESAKQTKDYEIQRLVYWYLEKHKLVLHQLFEEVPDGISFWNTAREKFIQSQPETPIPKNILGDICTVFSEAFKVSVVLKDKKAMRIMLKSLELYEKVVSFLIQGLIIDELGIGFDIRKELGKMKKELNKIKTTIITSSR